MEKFEENTQSTFKTMSNNNSRVTDRLNMERLKALEALKKSHKNDHTNLRKSRTPSISSEASNKETDHLAFVPACRPPSINISDLVMEDSIVLENNTTEESHISFEPSEITGRSTQYKSQNNVRETAARLSVSDILASSFAKKARELGQRVSNFSSDKPELNLSSISSCSSFNTSRSLLRTADMSRSKESILSLNGGSKFSFSSAVNGDASAFSNEEFAPIEVMRSKMLLDEIAWAQEYAVIPAAALSVEAQKIVNPSHSNTMACKFDSPRSISSTINTSGNFSVGHFFNMRSENISNIVQGKSPDKSRQPFALVDDTEDDENTVTTTNTELDGNETTPKNYNKKDNTVNDNTIALASDRTIEKHESKDSGRATDNSYLLSLSAIDRALCNIHIETDDSESLVIQQIKQHAKTQKLECNKSPKKVERIAKSKSKSPTWPNAQNLQNSFSFLIENKENLDPQTMRGINLSDTASFTESLLNCSDLKQTQLQNSSQQQRLPLSPLENHLLPEIRITDAANEADVDEWPSTPNKPYIRRVRRKKSPNGSKSPQETQSPLTHTNANGNENTCARTRPTSLSSTRVDGEKNPNIEIDFGNSPNLLKSTINRSSNNCSPATFDASPTSSPRSALSSQTSSPINEGYRSPQSDITTNSDKRFLGADGIVYKTVSSPARSEPSTNKYVNCNIYGTVPSRAISANLFKSTSNLAGRSISRCSNSSEFSHRDGKIIPLKVTTLELSWGSTKLRTEAHKSMQVKNISSKRLVVRIEIHGPGFQMVNNTQSNILTLQSQECRSINISFCPTVIGAAIGVLSFYSPMGNTAQSVSFLDIPLYGFGGHSSIIPQDILHGPVGFPFLPIGDLRDLVQPLERTFKIHNKGPLHGFAIINIDSIGLNLPRLCDTFEIWPQNVLIPSGSTAVIHIKFRPKREDIKKITKKITHVLTLANMRIICGDEANRQRMRHLVKQMHTDELEKIASNTLDMLWKQFPDEVVMDELKELEERPSVVMDLLTYMRIFEIAITLNNEALDESNDISTLLFPDDDDTVLFRTVCVNSPTPQENMLSPVNELRETVVVDNDCIVVVSSTNDNNGTWSVKPNILEFNLQAEKEKDNEHQSLLICNLYKSRQYFEILCSHKNVFSLMPNKGYINADGGQIQVEVRPMFEKITTDLLQENIHLIVQLENELKKVPVKFKDDISKY